MFEIVLKDKAIHTASVHQQLFAIYMAFLACANHIPNPNPNGANALLRLNLNPTLNLTRCDHH